MSQLNNNLADKFNPGAWAGWKAWKHYKHTGFNLIDEVNALDPDLVIDVGCGHNRFKGHIQNIIGFDQEPFPFVDIVSNIEDINFRKESVDVILALGSVQFGDRDLVCKHFAKVVDWVKPGGYIVMRTMRDSLTPYHHQQAHYIWTDNDITSIGNMHNLEIVKGPFVENVRDAADQIKSTRMAWWYKKSGELKKYQIDPYNCEITQR